MMSLVSMSVKPFAGDPVTGGWSALARGDWDSAWRCFASAVAQHETPEALEGLSWAAWWRADADALFDARERAYRAYRVVGKNREAARVAAWLGTDFVDFRGEIAVAQGWLRRARSLLSDCDPCPELGWLYVHEAEKSLVAGDSQRARDLGAQATQLGRRLHIVDLEMMGLATEGLALVLRGDVHEGITRLGEAAAAALAGEFTELWSAGWCCCYMIYGCEQVRDYDRAAQWCRQLEAWSERLHVEFLNRSCRAHYAGVLIWQGTWDKAEAELTQSAAHLAELRPPMAVEAMVRLGELRRRQGRLDEAAAIFEEAAEHPLAVLGSAELLLDDDEPASARERAEEYLRQTSSQAATPRAAGLELLVRAAAALGDLDGAAAALAELSTVAERIPTDAVRASVAYARGTVASAQGDRARARVAFEDAIRHYLRAGAPFEEARARLALARELGELGRPTDALRHARTAAQSLDRLGAARAAKAAHALVRRFEPVQGRSLLTKRERQVLRLVADGKTNRGIADALVLSEHTVNRHITNILAKLGAASRSAAVAEALRRDLL